MTKAEALALFEQLDFDLAVTLPARGTAHALCDLLEELGFTYGLAEVTGDWVVWDETGAEVARVS